MNPLSFRNFKCLKQVIVLKKVNSSSGGNEYAICKQKLMIKGSTMTLVNFLIRKLLNFPLPQPISQILQVIEAASMSAKRKRHILPRINFYIFKMSHEPLSHQFSLAYIAQENTACFFVPRCTIDKAIVILIYQQFYLLYFLEEGTFVTEVDAPSFSLESIVGYLHSILSLLGSEDSLPVGRWLEREEMLDVLAEADKLRFVSADFLDAESIARGEHDLLVLETLEIM